MAALEPMPSDQSSERTAAQGIAKPRRAFVACKLCRSRKTKCVFSLHEKSCQQCVLYGIQCVMGERGRKRRRSDPDTEQIDRRIEALEFWISMSQPATATASCRQTNDPQLPSESMETGPCQPSCVDNLSATRPFEFCDQAKSSQPAQQEQENSSMHDEPAYIHVSGPHQDYDDLLSRLLSRTGYLNNDAGRLRYSGPSTGLSVYDNHNSDPHLLPPCAAEREAANVIGTLSGRTHAYILESYWENFNSIIEVVPRESFLQGHCTDDRDLYSIFLHSAILAMGIRFVGKERSDIIQLMVSPYESIFHSMCKQMLGNDMEGGGGTSSIQALLLLSDLEYGCGRDRTGWMYAGMAYRLFFDLGLHMETMSLKLTNFEIELRQKAATACLNSDKYWSFIFVRPTSIKHSDVHHSPQMSPSLQSSVLYAAATALMDIAGKVSDICATHKSQVDLGSRAVMVILHGELERWQKGLHSSLVWSLENARNGTPGLFLLHQQYHATRIMLHRPFMDQTGAAQSRHSPFDDRADSLNSELICVESAQQIAIIFKCSNGRMEMRQSFTTAPQQAATGILVLIEVARRKESSEERDELLRHIYALKSILHELGHTYEHANRMYLTISMVLSESPWAKQSETPNSNNPREDADDARFTTDLRSQVSVGNDKGDVRDGNTEDKPASNSTEAVAGHVNDFGPSSAFTLRNSLTPWPVVQDVEVFDLNQDNKGEDMFLQGMDINSPGVNWLQFSK